MLPANNGAGHLEMTCADLTVSTKEKRGFGQLLFIGEEYCIETNGIRH